MGDLGARSHQDEHAVGRRIARVLEEPVRAPGQTAELRHRFADDLRACGDEAVPRLPGLEEDVGVLRGPSQNGTVGRKRPGAVRSDESVRDQGAKRVVVDGSDLRDFMRRAESVEEVEKRDARREGRRMGDRGEVLGLLDGAGREHRETGLAASHDVGVISEDRERVRGQRPRRHVHRERRQLSRDLVHVGYHQEEPLGGGECRRQRSRLKRSMHRSGRSALRLHLDDRRHRSPDVRAPGRRPLVGELTHRRRRGDRVDGDDFAQPMRHGCGGLVAVDGDSLVPSHGSRVERADCAALMRLHQFPPGFRVGRSLRKVDENASSAGALRRLD